ncbi:hypothetical protein, partial [Actinomyces haliotis]|uniref:hypothetical protein n=1 Tax=Actinomyces haliotis TaxID=1280843 RepID=UPI001E5DDC06
LLGLDAFFDELQGARLELGRVLLGHDPILLEITGRNETQGASPHEARVENMEHTVKGARNTSAAGPYGTRFACRWQCVSRGVRRGHT